MIVSSTTAERLEARNCDIKSTSEMDATIEATEDVTTTSGAEDTLDRSRSCSEGTLDEDEPDRISNKNQRRVLYHNSHFPPFCSTASSDDSISEDGDNAPPMAPQEYTTKVASTAPEPPTTSNDISDMSLEETILAMASELKDDEEHEPVIRPEPHHNSHKNHPPKKQVRFDCVQIREFSITIGDHPFTTQGVPITLDWNHYQFPALDIDLYERAANRRRRSTRRLLLTSFQRRDRLWRAGHSLEEIEEAAKKTEKEKFRRSMNLYCLPLFVLQEAWISQKEQFRRGLACTKRKIGIQSQTMVHRHHVNNSNNNNNLLNVDTDSIDTDVSPDCNNHNNHNDHDRLCLGESYQALERQVRKLHQAQLADADLEHGGLPPWRRHESLRQRRRISFRGSTTTASRPDYDAAPEDRSSIQSDAEFSVAMSESSRNSAAIPQQQQQEDGAYHTSEDSNFDYYHIRTDPRQHDKATEIILCSARRPHMRAFHGSWIGFFIAFVMWFAITPLLGEVKASLNLTNSQIWTSSLAGTAVTVLVRIFMGPLCDVFGARRCMAVIVVVSAIPCALTGLVQTASGLCAVRAFIGIAGAAFVPCQYWTSRMFAREVAGTANALVAGWGNLGGGVTQILMGSVLFPLFKLIFRSENEDGDDGMNNAEFAWRISFVVPSIIAFFLAYIYCFHCDDSPKGDFNELVRQQQIEMVSPFMSLFSAIQNRNVWLLSIQYACCFGVEITMTNATALYLKEEFGLVTEQAAAIASVFGWINLFARGLGGFFSDRANAAYGTKGRVAFQSFTLFMEGIGIIIFAFADTLGWAICSLAFLSLWVQSSEGSTYGIVPYVNRRFTGAVIGWVGCGGTLGGVIFSFFFREMTYQNAFFWMGVTASASSFLSLLLNMKSLAAIYNDKMRAERIKNTTNFTFHDDLPAHEEAPTNEAKSSKSS